jgi:type VI secretion system secreted protein VgrG
VKTDLGENVLLLRAFTGREEMSRLFRYQLELLSEDYAITPRDIVGQGITWSVNEFDKQPRFFHGLVSRFTAGGKQFRGFRTYRAEVVPWLWFLTRTANCRIFQKMKVPDIIEAIFGDLGFSDYQLSLQKDYVKWEYCVQYRETAFNFVSRLMEHEGIFYYFRHEEGKHTLVLTDNAGGYADCVENEVKYSSGSLVMNHIASWEHQYEFRSGKWTQTDYNFETPSTNLLTNESTLVSLPNVSKYELFDYPGEYEIKGDGGTDSRVRMEEEETPYDVITGSSQCCTFTPGGKFTLEDHDCPAENNGYVVLAVHHSAIDRSYLKEAVGAEYSNTFTCLPDSAPFRPARITPKPVVQGTQPALVVGPKGEEIYVDKYGRIKVQFYWDRLGQKDENSSCWIRVTQPWAGKQWGAAFWPRIGQEVIVGFVEGDPDRPIVVGTVYNGEQMPPYTLPDNKTQSGVKTRSTLKGDATNFNELRFEDKKGSEEIYFHAEKDFNRVVENNDTLKVGSDQADDGSQTIEIYKDRTETVKTGNEKITIEHGNRTVTVSQGDDKHEVTQGKRDVIVNGNDTHQIKQGNREVKIDMGNNSLKISMGNQTTKIDLGKSETEAMQSIELKVGQSSIKLDQTGVTIKGLMISIEGQVQTEMKGLITTVKGDAMLTVKGGITMIN